MTRTTRSTRRRRPPRRVGRLIVLFTACLLVGAGAVIAATNDHQGKVATNRGAPIEATSPTPTLIPTASPTPTPPPDTVDVPARGPETFTAARGTATAGGVGPRTITYRVEIENGLPFDVAGTATQIDGILGHRRGWTRTGRYTFKRAPDGELRIKVATPETTDRLCRPLRTNGILSCRNGDTVVINARRWSRGIDAYKGLTSYRHYVINHEVGHALGQRHRACPAAGRPAPVMQQQTISMQRCKPNPWPTRAEREYAPLPGEVNHPKGKP